jgi:hypothetical protein
MRLERLCEMRWAYRDGFELVKPYGGEEGLGYGEGTGTVNGERLSGTVRWANHPRRRSDGRMLPNGGGVLTTSEGAKLPFLFQGRTVFDGAVGSQLIVFWFEAADERYRWLNDAVCVAEGLIKGAGEVRIAVYECVNELGP